MESNPFDDWTTIATVEQENWQNSFGDRYWDRFEMPNEKPELFQKIAFSLYGIRKSEKTDENSQAEINNEIESFMDENSNKSVEEKIEQLTHILNIKPDEKDNALKIIDKFVTHSVSENYVDIAVIFVYIYKNPEYQCRVPLYRVRSVANETEWEIPNCVFVDHVKRVYLSWRKYKEDNTWHMSWLCVPPCGYYKNERRFQLIDQKKRGKIIDVADKVSTVTSLTSAAGMLVSIGLTLFPPTAPFGAMGLAASAFVGVPGAVYGTGRSISTLVDRKKHKQSIGLEDPEARACWLSTACSAVSVGSMASTQLLATASRNGNLASNWVRMGVTGLAVTNLSVSALSVINMGYNMYQKDEVTGMDIFQMGTSIFFLTHSVANFQTAGDIIKGVQKKEIDAMKIGLGKKAAKRFETTLNAHKEVGGDIGGQAEFVRSMNKIDVKKFYTKVRFTPDKKLVVNPEQTMDPQSFVKLPEDQRANLFNKSYQAKTDPVIRNNCNAPLLSKKSDEELKGESKSINIPLTLTELTTVGAMLNQWCNGERDFIDFAEDFAVFIIEKLGIQNGEFYINLLRYAINEVKRRIKAWRERNSGTEEEAREQVLRDLRESHELNINFDEMYERHGENVFNHLDAETNGNEENSDLNYIQSNDEELKGKSKSIIIPLTLAELSTVGLIQWCNGGKDFIDFATDFAEFFFCMEKFAIENKQFQKKLLRYAVNEVKRRERNSGTEEKARKQVLRDLRESHELNINFDEMYQRHGENVFNHLNAETKGNNQHNTPSHTIRDIYLSKIVEIFNDSPSDIFWTESLDEISCKFKVNNEEHSAMFFIQSTESFLLIIEKSDGSDVIKEFSYN